MELPIRRRSESQPGVDTEFDRLRRSLARDLDRWPEVIEELSRTMADVVPQADIEERDDSYLFDIELPGVKGEDVSVVIEQGRLVVTGERRERHRVGLLRHRTRTTGRFRLAVTLPRDVDGEGVTATLDHGLLTVVVPKAEHARPRRIPVRHGER